MYRILVAGYYHHKNLGDDLFQHVFEQYIFSDTGKYTLTIVQLADIISICQQIDDGNIEAFDYLVIGGGDLVNDYFFNEQSIACLRKTFRTTPIIMYGIGLSYPSTLKTLDIADYILMRNKTDHDAAKARYSPYYATFTPDLAFHCLSDKSLPLPQTASAPNIQIQHVGFCLPYTWFVDSDCTFMNTSFFNQIIQLIRYQVQQQRTVHLIPFDTSANACNSDILLIQRLKSVFDEEPSIRDNIVYPSLGGESFSETLSNYIAYFNSLDLVFGSRYHSVIMSILTNKPWISLYSTRKLQTLATDVTPMLKRLFIPLVLDKNQIPIALDMHSITETEVYVQQNYSTIVQAIHSLRLSFYNAAVKAKNRVYEITETPDLNVRYTPPQYIAPQEKQALLSKTVMNILQCIDKLTNKNQKLVESGFPISKILSRRKHASTGQVEAMIAEEILYTITDDPYAPYYYGLLDTVLADNLVSQLDWVIDDYYEKYKFKSNPNSVISLVNKNFQELHRSGWQYIIDNLVTTITSQVQNLKQNSLIIDMYVDKTFHWNKSFYVQKNIVPYTSAWIGFIHHTYSYYNNHYNCDVLFRDPEFIASLHHCKCLIVMSKYLQRNIKNSIQKLIDDGLLSEAVTVEVVYHPSEVTKTVFDWNIFTANDNKQVVQIGNWLRDVHAIYQLELPPTSEIQTKVVLKNKNSDNYLPPLDLLDSLFQVFNTKGRQLVNNNVLDICKITFQNMHVKGLYEYIVKIENSVTIMEYVDNEEYDELLSKNVVFIKLIDASAVNTIVECILRNTPILVNPIEPVVETLGVGYPLYYNDTFEASSMLTDLNRIQRAHEYLKKMNKTPFLIHTFMKTMEQIITRYL